MLTNCLSVFFTFFYISRCKRIIMQAQEKQAVASIQYAHHCPSISDCLSVLIPGSPERTLKRGDNAGFQAFVFWTISTHPVKQTPIKNSQVTIDKAMNRHSFMLCCICLVYFAQLWTIMLWSLAPQRHDGNLYVNLQDPRLALSKARNLYNGPGPKQGSTNRVEESFQHDFISTTVISCRFLCAGFLDIATDLTLDFQFGRIWGAAPNDEFCSPFLPFECHCRTSAKLFSKFSSKKNKHQILFLKNCLFDETSHHQKSAAFIKELWHPRHWPPRPCAQIRAWQRWMPSFNGMVGPRVFLGVAGGVFVGVAGGVLAKTRRGVREGLLGTSLAGLEGCVTQVCVWKQSKWYHGFILSNIWGDSIMTTWSCWKQSKYIRFPPFDHSETWIWNIIFYCHLCYWELTYPLPVGTFESMIFETSRKWDMCFRSLGRERINGKNIPEGADRQGSSWATKKTLLLSIILVGW